ncbi:MAG TPA: hypothetical protein VHB51_03660 [Candidatus Saccharimonadales bacterium]|nr:hypothetical protein [Candidatus Saccharimonadales bacterium]
MATRAELEAYDARDAAIAETREQVLRETEAGIKERLDAAQLGLAGAILSVAEVCGATPGAIEELRFDVDTRAGEVVKLIFEAAVQEVGKQNDAESAAEYAGRVAQTRKLEEINEAQISAAFRSRSSRPVNPDFIQRRPTGRV